MRPREIVVHTMHGPDGPHLIYEMAECHPDFFTKEETWRLVERATLEQFQTDAQELLNALDELAKNYKDAWVVELVKKTKEKWGNKNE